MRSRQIILSAKAEKADTLTRVPVKEITPLLKEFLNSSLGLAKVILDRPLPPDKQIVVENVVRFEVMGLEHV